MNYKIQITKAEPNPNFKDELAQWKEDNRFEGYSSSSREIPQAEVIKDVLIVELTEDQFKAVKAAVIKEFI